MKKGDVYRVYLPRPQGASGHEQFGERPAIIVQSEGFTDSLSTVVVVPLTSKSARACLRGAVPIAKTTGNGLTVDSIALTNQVRAIDKTRCSAVLGALSEADLRLIDNELRSLFSI